MNTSAENPAGGQRAPRARKTSDTVKIALISALTAIVTALITAGVTIYQSTLAAEKAAAEAGAAAASANQSAANAKQSEEKASRSVRAEEALTATRCPSAATREGLPLFKTFTDQYEDDKGSSRELLNIQGRGCLMSGLILGYYFQNTANGRNYTISINLDSYEFTYPTNTDGKTVAYAQDRDGQNTGVLVLPQLAFRNSLRISYYYPGGGKEIAAHALVSYQTD